MHDDRDGVAQTHEKKKEPKHVVVEFDPYPRHIGIFPFVGKFSLRMEIPSSSQLQPKELK